MRRFQNDLAIVVHAERVGIEDDGADCDKSEDTQDVEPMENARSGVPHFVLL